MAPGSDMTQIQVGTSSDAGAAEAARAAVDAALRDVREPVMALVFATPQYPPAQLAAALNERLGSLPWAGCTSVGVFAGLELLTEGVVVAVFGGGGTRAQIGLAHGVAASPHEAGRTAVAQALAGMAATPAGRQRLMVVLPDTSVASSADILRGAIDEGGNGVVWAGGGAGDMLGHHRLVQFAEGGAHSDSVVVIAIDLPVAPQTGVRHGWRPFGPPAQVTRAAGNVAYELEYRDAFEVYREAARGVGADVDEQSFGEYAMFHPLGIPQANDQYLVRDPVAAVEGALRCVAEIPDGAVVRMMWADREAMVKAAGDAAVQARGEPSTPLAGALVFDCISRYLILGAAFDHELGAFRDALGPAVPVFGCLTFGEVASFEWEVPQFHNKTTVVVAIAGGDGAA